MARNEPPLWVSDAVTLLGGVMWMVVFFGLIAAVLRVAWWGFTGG